MKSRSVIVDARVDKQILQKLGYYAEDVFPFRSEGLTYESISCHPDIFVYQDKENVIVAPNVPQQLIEYLQKKNIPLEKGKSNIGFKQIDSCYYNCISTRELFLHREGFTDPLVLEKNKGKRFINLPQSYTRCSMFALSEIHFITSDPGIHKALGKEGLVSFLFSPNEIRIVDHQYGFLGGTCGMQAEKIFFLGNPLRHKDGRGLVSFIEKEGKECISLCNNYLYDGGGLFFL